MLLIRQLPLLFVLLMPFPSKDPLYVSMEKNWGLIWMSHSIDVNVVVLLRVRLAPLDLDLVSI